MFVIFDLIPPQFLLTVFHVFPTFIFVFLPITVMLHLWRGTCLQCWCVSRQFVVFALPSAHTLHVLSGKHASFRVVSSLQLFQPKFYVSHHSNVCCITCQCHPNWFDHTDTIWWRVQIMKLILKFLHDPVSLHILGISIYFFSRSSPVSIVCVARDWTIEVRSLAEAKDFSSSFCVQTGSGAHPMGTGALSPWVNCDGRDADHSPYSSAEVVNE
jgi:hypothetical protein